MLFQSCFSASEWRHRPAFEVPKNNSDNTSTSVVNSHHELESSKIKPLKSDLFPRVISSAWEYLLNPPKKPNDQPLSTSSTNAVHQKTSINAAPQPTAEPLSVQRYQALIAQTTELLSKHAVTSQTPIQLNSEIKSHFEKIAHECAGNNITDFANYETTAEPKPKADTKEEHTCLRDLLFSLKLLDFTFSESDTFFILKLLNDHSALSKADTSRLMSYFSRQAYSFSNAKENLAILMNSDATTEQVRLGLLNAFLDLCNEDPMKLASANNHIKQLSANLNNPVRQTIAKFNVVTIPHGYSAKLSIQKPEDSIPAQAKVVPLASLFPAKTKLPY